MYQSRRAGDEAKKRKSPAKSGRVGITALCTHADQEHYCHYPVFTLSAKHEYQ